MKHVSRRLDIRTQVGPRCSAYAASCLLRYEGKNSDPVELYKLFAKLPDGSALPRAVGRKIEYKMKTRGTLSDIEKMIDEDHPVLILGFYDEDAGFNNLHYMLVTGYDDDFIYLADSLERPGALFHNREIPREVFLKMWDTSRLWLTRFLYGKNIYYVKN